MIEKLRVAILIFVGLLCLTVYVAVFTNEAGFNKISPERNLAGDLDSKAK